MNNVLELAIEVQALSKELLEYFRIIGNRPRMTHMQIIFDAVKSVRFKLEEAPDQELPPDCWKAKLEIELIGYMVHEDTEAYEKLVRPLYEKYELLHSSYIKVYGNT